MKLGLIEHLKVNNSTLITPMRTAVRKTKISRNLTQGSFIKTILPPKVLWII